MTDKDKKIIALREAKRNFTSIRAMLDEFEAWLTSENESEQMLASLSAMWITKYMRDCLPLNVSESLSSMKAH